MTDHHLVVTRRDGSGRYVQVRATSPAMESWCKGQVAEWEPGFANTLLQVDALRLLDRARAVGHTVELVNLVETSTPGGRYLVPVTCSPEELALSYGKPARPARDVHQERLRALRGQLTGEDKTAIRWALEHIARLEKRLADIRRLT